MHIITIGGGNGQSFFLKSLLLLKATSHPHIRISSIVSMSDDGRTTGKLMCTYARYIKKHLPPPGDLRRPLYILSTLPDTAQLQEEMEYTYTDERLISTMSLSDYLQEFKSIHPEQKSHLLEMLNNKIDRALPIPESRNGYKRGNLLMATLFFLCDENLKTVMTIMRELLQVDGDIYPITQDKALIQALTDQEELVISQDHISNNPDAYSGKILKVELTPESKTATINQDIPINTQDAPYLIITPGDIHTSIGANFLPNGARDWIQQHPGKIIFIMNPINKDGEARNLNALEYLLIIENYIGRTCDYILATSSSQDWSKIAGDISVKNGEPFVMTSQLQDILRQRGSEIILSDLKDSSQLTYRYDISKLANVLKEILV